MLHRDGGIGTFSIDGSWTERTLMGLIIAGSRFVGVAMRAEYLYEFSQAFFDHVIIYVRGYR